MEHGLFIGLAQDCYSRRSGRGASGRAALISSTKGSAPMIARLSMRHAVMRHVLAALVALAVIGSPGRPRPSGAAAARRGQPSPARNTARQADRRTQRRQGRVRAAGARRGRQRPGTCSCRPTSCGRRTSTKSRSSWRSSSTPRDDRTGRCAARIYASHFTEQELRDLLTFYQSPLGQKGDRRGAESARREHGRCRRLGRQSFPGSHRQHAR